MRGVVAEMAALGMACTVSTLGDDPASADVCVCSSASAARGPLALFTTFVSLESPLRCLDRFLPVPLYRVPAMASGDFNELICWMSDYPSCDRLQMNCSTLERAATREISRVDRALSTRGRAHAAAIAASTGRPTYYHLHRGHGRSRAAEAARRCPSCDGEWLLARRQHLFDFRCDRCHLLSNIAWNVRD